MELEFLTEKNRERIAKNIVSIRAFEAGDDNYYDTILSLIKEIKSDTRSMLYYVAKYKIIIAKSISHYTSEGFIDEDIKNKYGLCNSYLNYYWECYSILKEYLRVGKRTGNYPDFEAAYMLTIHLPGMLFNINDYLDEINTTASSYKFNYTYVGTSSIETKCQERMNNVVTLVNAIRPEH